MQNPLSPEPGSLVRSRQDSQISHDYRLVSLDEGFVQPGEPRRSHEQPLSSLARLGEAGLLERLERIRKRELEEGCTYGATNEQQTEPVDVDLVPRVITSKAWERVQAGVIQRTRALEAFLEDVYGAAHIVEDGVVPRSCIERAPGYRPELSGRLTAQRKAIICGFDVVMDEDGEFVVVEDNLRIPSGMGYALGTRQLMQEVLPELFLDRSLVDPTQACARLKETFRRAAPRGCLVSAPQTVIVAAEDCQAQFALRVLSERLDVPVVHPKELIERGKVLYAQHEGSLLRVDIAYLRTHDALDVPRGDEGHLTDLLLRCADAGNLTLINPWGNGVADDKAIYAFVPNMINYYLNERPILKQANTFIMADQAAREHALGYLDQMVIKPVDGSGGQGVIIGPDASDAELESVRRDIEESPERWVTQEVVHFSTHPSVHDGRLVPRHIDLRVFTFHADHPVVPPCPLTRMAPEDSMVVNSGRGGGLKDTWIVKD